MPKNETGMVVYVNTDGIPVFLLTTKQGRDFYYLYKIASDGTLSKLGKARSPKELEEKYEIRDKINGRS